MSAAAEAPQARVEYASWIDDTETPVSAFLKLSAAAPGEPAFLLESAEHGRVGRYSFLGHRPRATLRWRLGDPGDPYALAAAAVAAHAPAAPAEDPTLPPFLGGAVGMFAYDLVRTVEPSLGAPNPDPLGTPDLALMLTDTLVVFDHLQHRITVIAHTYPDEPDGAGAVKIEAVATALSGALPRGSRAGEPAPPPPDFRSNLTREQFEANVARIIDYIRAGDAYQVVPSQRWSAPTELSAFSIYRGLRAVNPSPYMYYLDFGDFQIAGASPEPLVTVTGRRVATTPIAGTRPRGTTAEEDARLAAELLADPKERAEHVMLVDMGRNDIGRVSQYGTVRVDELMAIEHYSHVMHIVSNVSGTLAPGVTALDALAAVNPVGTLSGAPKVRAIEIIDELEPVKRGGYGGAIGYVSYGGDLDTCVHIRTAVIKDGWVHIQAGGGTVADANPASEYEESVNKSAALRAAIELARTQEGWQ
ncbi:anthranilate synthase component I [Conexibacter sp. DBS9H8]|uniref:anthranilate synthase component I n=1 Tax=Conexibacter sp. DBS9H8 TaxID=2937801 RepID=UPI00200EFDC1|nr:anthranilate synthase component I [Conexibacter sp. DBS9H8]